MHKFQKEISTLGLMERLLSINRARFWAADACKHGLVAEHYSLGNMKFLSRSAIPAVQPFVIPAGADAKDAAPFREWHAIELAIREGLTNEGVLHLRPVVLRYAANFFMKGRGSQGARGPTAGRGICSSSQA